MLKRFVAIAISAAMVLTTTPAAVLAETGSQAGSTASSAEEIVLEEGTYAPGEVIVLFKAGYVEDQKMSLSKATGLDNVDEDFGEMMEKPQMMRSQRSASLRRVWEMTLSCWIR